MNLKDKLLAQADGLALMAEEAAAVAKHFRPRFDACWQGGQMVDPDTAVRLRVYVITREDEAKRMRREEAELREAAAVLVTRAQR